MLSDELKERLVQSALDAQKWSYSPYSRYPVGAAVLTRSGRVYDGTNIENAAYPVSICAERVAVFKAVSEGEHEIEAVAVVTRNGGAPCGSCRQVLAEFGLEAIVLIADQAGEIRQETTVSALLPGAFTPDKLVE
ncbi:MAG: cytidine deaminase [Chloroflexi bacterium]|nr:cytidine deaminase [Chloroflexota bacterium]